ncbi:MAG: hypothetical protein CTR55_15345 [Pseudomonas sp.]|nr:MAG: hypothetical protein CTR55_15345 [Pseudomonas sp.]
MSCTDSRPSRLPAERCSSSSLTCRVANGKQDEVIRVKNLRSQKIIEAKVMASGEVSSIF